MEMERKPNNNNNHNEKKHRKKRTAANSFFPLPSPSFSFLPSHRSIPRQGRVKPVLSAPSTAN